MDISSPQILKIGEFRPKEVFVVRIKSILLFIFYLCSNAGFAVCQNQEQNLNFGYGFEPEEVMYENYLRRFEFYDERHKKQPPFNTAEKYFRIKILELSNRYKEIKNQCFSSDIKWEEFTFKEIRDYQDYKYVKSYDMKYLQEVGLQKIFAAFITIPSIKIPPNFLLNKIWILASGYRNFIKTKLKQHSENLEWYQKTVLASCVVRHLITYEDSKESEVILGFPVDFLYFLGKAKCKGFAIVFDDLANHIGLKSQIKSGLVKDEIVYRKHTFNKVTSPDNKKSYIVDGQRLWYDSIKKKCYLLTFPD